MIALICACCNERCLGKQWWNRDTGFGACPRCAYNADQDEVRSLYGNAGEHYAAELTKECQPGMLVGWCSVDGKTWHVGTLKAWDGEIAIIREHLKLLTGEPDKDVLVRPVKEGDS